MLINKNTLQTQLILISELEKEYKGGTVLKYKTANPYDDLTLKQDYKFNWDKVNDLYFLKLKI